MSLEEDSRHSKKPSIEPTKQSSKELCKQFSWALSLGFLGSKGSEYSNNTTGRPSKHKHSGVLAKAASRLCAAGAYLGGIGRRDVVGRA